MELITGFLVIKAMKWMFWDEPLKVTEERFEAEERRRARQERN